MRWLVRNNFWPLLMIGTFVWSLTLVKSGLVYEYGMGFWGPNGHDGIWHLSLINSLSRFRSEMPIFAGSSIQNYHIGFDLLVALLHRFTFVSASVLYFQILPPVFALLIGWLAYRFTRSLWSVFWVYFGGSWGWLVSLIRNGNTGGESMFWSQQAISTLLNPPFALSVILLLAGLLCLRARRFWPAVIIFGLVGQIKVYAGLLALIGLFCSGIFDFFRYKKIYFLKCFAGSAVLFLVLFLSFNRNSSALVVFRPFWFLETLMALSDRLNWPRFYQAMTNYLLANNWPKAVIAYAAAFVIFLAGNLGTRILVLLDLRRLRRFSAEDIFVYTVILGGIAAPLFFLQKGTPWNTIQFFYYSQFFLGLLAGISVSEILKIWKLNYYLKIGTWILVAGLTLPTTFDTLKHYLPGRPPAKIGREELAALAFLKARPRGVVLTPVFDRSAAIAATAFPPRPLYLYESTAYVSALAVQPVFLEDEVNLNITGYDWPARRQAVHQFFSQTDISAARRFLAENNVKYLYLPQVAAVRPVLSPSELDLTNIFENSEVAIWARE